MEVFVSVIIPNYNHAPYLEQRINSVLCQTFKDFEVIILDDNSTDNSRDIIELYRGNSKVTHIVYNQTNSGSPFIQWRKGINLAEGRYIWVAESDDYADLTFLERVVSKLENDLEIAICYTASNIIENAKVIVESKPWLFYSKLFRTNRWSDDFENDGKQELTNYLGGFCTIINASSCVFRKSAFPAQNKNIYKFKYCGDWLIWIEMCLKGKVAYISEPLNYFRIHAKSTVSKFSPVKKANEMYYCLLRARRLTDGKSIIPTQTKNIIFHMWTYDSLYFFIKNFSFTSLIMHSKIDKKLGQRILSLFKNYYRVKLDRR